MSISKCEASVNHVWFDEENMWLALHDGRKLAVPLVWFPRLQNATAEQRITWELSGGGTGIHWEEIDEDISVPGLILGNKDTSYYRARI